MSDPQQEYEAALAAYNAAMVRLREAKRHIPQTPRMKAEERDREERRQRREDWKRRHAAYLASQPND